MLHSKWLLGGAWGVGGSELSMIGLQSLVSQRATALQMTTNESVILCSDGLTDMLSDSVICRTLDNCRDIGAGVLELDRLAMKAGGRDNIAIVAVTIQGR
jgi:serine/threonine protein phosphatase PrpC